MLPSASHQVSHSYDTSPTDEALTRITEVSYTMATKSTATYVGLSIPKGHKHARVNHRHLAATSVS
jgi:hypothetical protein